jgi:hypothetical protein
MRLEESRQVAWVVTCKVCRCVITCFAIDPQLEHGKSEIGPPAHSAVLTCPCCWGAYRYSGLDIVRGRPRRSPACRRKQQRPPISGALLVAASIVAAIRLRGEPIERTSKVVATIHDSVRLAEMVLAQLER